MRSQWGLHLCMCMCVCIFHATMGTRIPDVTRRSATHTRARAAHLRDLFFFSFLFDDAQKESEGVK